MNAPPPFSESKKPGMSSGNKVAIALIVFLVIPCIGSIFLMFTLFKGGMKLLDKELKPGLQCAMTYKLGRTAIFDYAAANDGKLPPAEDWQDKVRKYYEKAYARSAEKMNDAPKQLRFLPSEPNGDWGCVIGDGKNSGMFYNSDVAGKKLDDISDREKTVLLFESLETGKNLHRPYKPVDDKLAPMRLGSQEWFIYYFKGQRSFDESKQKGAVNINIDDDEDLPTPGPSAKPKADAPVTKT